MTLEELKKIFGVNTLAGTEDEVKTLLRWSEELAQERGVEYLKQNSQMLLNQWDHIRSNLL
jgi:hypothetical protein